MCGIDFFVSVRDLKKNYSVQNDFGSVFKNAVKFGYYSYLLLM